ncbi:hypothetical protein Tco_0707675, partial [Tanacetum coccineum]
MENTSYTGRELRPVTFDVSNDMAMKKTSFPEMECSGSIVVLCALNDNKRLCRFCEAMIWLR